MHLGTKVWLYKAPVTWKSTKSHRLLPPTYRLWNKTAWPVESCEQQVTLFRPAVRSQSSTHFSAQRVGNGLRKPLDIGAALGFHHHPSQGLGAGIAQHHPPIRSQSRSGFFECAQHLRKRIERRFGFHLYVYDYLRIVLQSFDQRFERAFRGHERGDLDGGQQPIAGRAVVEKYDVPRLLSAQVVSRLEHLFKNVAITDGCPDERDSFAGEHPFESQVGHRRGYHSSAFQCTLCLEVAGGGEQHSVSVHHLAPARNKERAVGIAVKGHAHDRSFGNHALLQLIEIERSTARVDVTTIRIDAHGHHVGSKGPEQFRPQLVSGAIRAIENDAKTAQLGLRKGVAAKELEVLPVKGLTRGERRAGRRYAHRAATENFRFDDLFLRVRKFHPGMREEFYSIVVIRIVRSR